MKNKTFGFVIDLCIFLIALIFICANLKTFIYSIAELPKVSLFVMICAIALVHIVKAFRFYFAMYGSKIILGEYLRIYCKVTFVSIIFPFKTGEIYRIYCYKKPIGNFFKSAILVILDRFFDTMAVLTLVLSKGLFSRERLNSFIYILVVFLIIVILIYFIFPELYKFWMKYLLGSKATSHTIYGMKNLYTLHSFYEEVVSAIKGRGVILYGLSLVAWSIETACLIITEKTLGNQDIGNSILEYLTASLRGKYNIALTRFSFISIIILLAAFSMLLIIQKSKIHREKLK